MSPFNGSLTRARGAGSSSPGEPPRSRRRPGSPPGLTATSLRLSVRSVVGVPGVRAIAERQIGAPLVGVRCHSIPTATG